jgi:uncharacterized protein (DUF1778 family)
MDTDETRQLRGRVVTARLSDDEAALVERAASTEMLSLSAFARQAMVWRAAQTVELFQREPA